MSLTPWPVAACAKCEVRLQWASTVRVNPADYYCPRCGTALQRVGPHGLGHPWPLIFLCLWHHPTRYRTGWTERRKRRKAHCSVDDPCSPHKW